MGTTLGPGRGSGIYTKLVTAHKQTGFTVHITLLDTGNMDVALA